MRIALVSHEYPPFAGGGIGTYATVMSAALARAGHEVHVITNRFSFGSTDPVHQRADHQEGNLWVHRIPGLTDDWEPAPPHNAPFDPLGRLHREWSPYLYYSEFVAQELATLCDRHDIEVIEFPECAAEGYMTIRRKRLGLGFARRPITVTLHSPIYEIHQYNLYSRFNVGFQRRTMMEEYSIRYADAVNSPSRLLADMVYKRMELSPGQPPCDIIPLPMDFASLPLGTERFSPPIQQPSEPPTLLFVGRLEPRKGVRYLIDAAVRVMHKHPSLRVLLIGRDCEAGEASGMMTDFLRSRIPSPLQNRFVFRGPMPRSELFAEYARATACVFAAPWDNFPMTCAEAMSAGACVIASDYTGMAEMIEHERSGLLFESRNVDSLTASIERVLVDGELLNRIRRNAPTRIQQVCDSDRAVKNRIAHYERTIEAHARTSAARLPCSLPASRRIAVFITPGSKDAALKRTIESVKKAAGHANIEADITVGGGESNGTSACEGGTRHARSAQAHDPLRAWVERLVETTPDYMLMLGAGETLAEEYLSAVQSILVRSPEAAWATTWLRSTSRMVGSYAGFDFSAPLELLAYHPVPLAVIRYGAFRQVGGWDLDLPAGWRDWDLWLTFEQAGLKGLVVPCWLGDFVPQSTGAPVPLSPERLALVYEKILARSRSLLERDAALLWLFRATNSATTLPFASSEQGWTSSIWRQWRELTRVCLKQQFPKLAGLYRRWKSR